MKLIIVTWCLIASLAEAVYTPSICKFVGYRRDKSDETNYVHAGASSFPSFIKSSYLFVDKSAYIEYIIDPNGNKRHMINLPRKWGKSLNLDMLRFFLQAEVSGNGTIKPSDQTAAYKFFVEGKVSNGDGTYRQLEHPPQISKKHEIIRKYLAKYSVVKLDLTGLRSCVSSEEEFYRCLNLKISALYEQFSYVDSFIEKAAENDVEHANTDFTNFRKLSNYSYTAHRIELMESIRTLCRSIYLHFNKKIVILIEEYDEVYKGLFINENHISNVTVENIVQFFRMFLRESVKLNWYFDKVVITGISEIVEEDLYSEWINTMNISLLNHGKSEPFHGFTQAEVDMLLAAVDKSPQAKGVKDWYDGYHCLENPSILYQPSSIVSFLDNEILACTWTRTEITNLIMNVFEKNFQLKLMLQNLVNNNTHLAIPMKRIRISADEFEIIEPYFKKSPPGNLKITDMVRDLLFGLLTTYGYFTPSPKQDIENKIKLTVPNVEVRSELANVFDDFAANLIHPYFNISLQVASSIESFLCKNQTISDTLEEDISILYGEQNLMKKAKHQFDSWTLEDLRNVGARSKTEAAMYDIMISVLLLQKSRTFRSLPWEVHCYVQRNDTRMELFFYNNKRAIVIELKNGTNDSTSTMFDQILQSSLFFKEKQLPFETVKYLRVNLHGDKIDVVSMMKSKSELKLSNHS